MNRSLIPFLGFLIVLLAGCVSGGKVPQFFQAGTLSTQNYRTALSFEDRSGLIVIPVTIGGKVRHFLLDTGAPNVITPELAAEIGVQSEFARKVNDTHGNSKSLDFVRLDSLSLGEVVFYGTGAIIGDLNASPELACLGVDGLIGANLLSKTFLQINYQKREVVLASLLDSLQIDSSALVWKFSPTIQGTPEVRLRANGKLLGPLTIDTGAGTWIGAPEKALEQVKEAGPLQVRRTFGSASIGLFGAAQGDSLYWTWVDALSLPDSTSLPPGSVEFFGKERSLIGNAYLKQFILTFDWQVNELLLSPTGFSDTESLKTFGFSPRYQDGQFLVRFVWEDSPAAQEGLLPGDRILFMNGMDFVNMDEKGYCRFLLDNKMKNEWNELDLLIEQDGATRRLKLQKEPFFIRD